MRETRRPVPLGVPLLRGLGPYMSYWKGPLALYALSEYVGEEWVHRALRHLLETHTPQEAPLATTLDLYRELQVVTPDSLQYLLHDLFEVNTFWEFETERATAVETDAGTWRVTLDMRTRKVVADNAGVKTEVPMDEWVQVGTFGAAEKGGDELSQPLYVQKRHVLSLPLSRLEERLDPTRFVRVHRAHIVNLDHVCAFRPDARGNLRAELTDGTLVPVSRSRAQALRRLGL